MATGEIVEPDGFYATLKEKDEKLISKARFPRDFNEEEQALYIDIIRDGKTVRSDYSVNYDHKFFS